MKKKMSFKCSTERVLDAHGRAASTGETGLEQEKTVVAIDDDGDNDGGGDQHTNP